MSNEEISLNIIKTINNLNSNCINQLLKINLKNEKLKVKINDLKDILYDFLKLLKESKNVENGNNIDYDIIENNLFFIEKSILSLIKEIFINNQTKSIEIILLFFDEVINSYVDGKIVDDIFEKFIKELLISLFYETIKMNIPTFCCEELCTIKLLNIYSKLMKFKHFNLSYNNCCILLDITEFGINLISLTAKTKIGISAKEFINEVIEIMFFNNSYNDESSFSKYVKLYLSQLTDIILLDDNLSLKNKEINFNNSSLSLYKQLINNKTFTNEFGQLNGIYGFCYYCRNPANQIYNNIPLCSINCDVYYQNLSKKINTNSISKEQSFLITMNFIFDLYSKIEYFTNNKFISNLLDLTIKLIYMIYIPNNSYENNHFIKQFILNCYDNPILLLTFDYKIETGYNSTDKLLDLLINENNETVNNQKLEDLKFFRIKIQDFFLFPIIKNRIFDVFLKFKLSNDISIFKKSLSVLLLIIHKFHKFLIDEIENYISKVLLIILESTNFSFEHKVSIIDFFIVILNSTFALEFYINCDLKSETKMIFIDIIEILSKISLDLFTNKKYKLLLNKKQQDYLKSKSLEAINIFISMLKINTLNIVSLTENSSSFNSKSFSLEFNKAKLQNTSTILHLGLDSNININGNKENNFDKLNKEQDVKMNYEKTNNDEKINEEDLKFINYFQTNYDEELVIKNNLENKKQIIRMIEKFNVNPDHLTKYLRENNFILDKEKFNIKQSLSNSEKENEELYFYYEVQEIINFVFKYKKNLNKNSLGKILCGSEKLNKIFLKTYINQFNFEGLTLIDAMRMLFDTFILSGEGQIIDRVIELFGNKYQLDNKDVYKENYTAYYLAYNILLLQTDLHREEVVKKISCNKFIEQVNLLTKEIDEESLKKIYETILTNPIYMPNDNLTPIISSNIKTNEKSNNSRLSYNDLMITIEKNSINREINEFNSENKEERKLKNYTKKIKIFHIKSLVEQIWSSILASLSQSFNFEIEEPFFIEKIINDCLNMAILSGKINLLTVSEVFINCVLIFMNNTFNLDKTLNISSLSKDDLIENLFSEISKMKINKTNNNNTVGNNNNSSNINVNGNYDLANYSGKIKKVYINILNTLFNFCIYYGNILSESNWFNILFYLLRINECHSEFDFYFKLLEENNKNILNQKEDLNISTISSISNSFKRYSLFNLASKLFYRESKPDLKLPSKDVVNNANSKNITNFINDLDNTSDDNNNFNIDSNSKQESNKHNSKVKNYELFINNSDFLNEKFDLSLDKIENLYNIKINIQGKVIENLFNNTNKFNQNSFKNFVNKLIEILEFTIVKEMSRINENNIQNKITYNSKLDTSSNVSKSIKLLINKINLVIEENNFRNIFVFIDVWSNISILMKNYSSYYTKIYGLEMINEKNNNSNNITSVTPTLMTDIKSDLSLEFFIFKELIQFVKKHSLMILTHPEFVVWKQNLFNSLQIEFSNYSLFNFNNSMYQFKYMSNNVGKHNNIKSSEEYHKYKKLELSIFDTYETNFNYLIDSLLYIKNGKNSSEEMNRIILKIENFIHSLMAILSSKVHINFGHLDKIYNNNYQYSENKKKVNIIITFGMLHIVRIVKKGILSKIDSLNVLFFNLIVEIIDSDYFNEISFLLDTKLEVLSEFLECIYLFYSIKDYEEKSLKLFQNFISILFLSNQNHLHNQIQSQLLTQNCKNVQYINNNIRLNASDNQHQNNYTSYLDLEVKNNCNDEIKNNDFFKINSSLSYEENVYEDIIILNYQKLSNDILNNSKNDINLNLINKNYIISEIIMRIISSCDILISNNIKKYFLILGIVLSNIRNFMDAFSHLNIFINYFMLNSCIFKYLFSNNSSKTSIACDHLMNNLKAQLKSSKDKNRSVLLNEYIMILNEFKKNENFDEIKCISNSKLIINEVCQKSNNKDVICESLNYINNLLIDKDLLYENCNKSEDNNKFISNKILSTSILLNSIKDNEKKKGKTEFNPDILENYIIEETKFIEIFDVYKKLENIGFNNLNLKEINLKEFTKSIFDNSCLKNSSILNIDNKISLISGVKLEFIPEFIQNFYETIINFYYNNELNSLNCSFIPTYLAEILLITTIDHIFSKDDLYRQSLIKALVMSLISVKHQLGNNFFKVFNSKIMLKLNYFYCLFVLGNINEINDKEIQIYSDFLLFLREYYINCFNSNMNTEAINFFNINELILEKVTKYLINLKIYDSEQILKLNNERLQEIHTLYTSYYSVVEIILNKSDIELILDTDTTSEYFNFTVFLNKITGYIDFIQFYDKINNKSYKDIDNNDNKQIIYKNTDKIEREKESPELIKNLFIKCIIKDLRLYIPKFVKFCKELKEIEKLFDNLNRLIIISRDNELKSCISFVFRLLHKRKILKFNLVSKEIL